MLATLAWLDQINSYLSGKHASIFVKPNDFRIWCGFYYQQGHPEMRFHYKLNVASPGYSSTAMHSR